MTYHRGGTRQKILVEASRLFAERGYHGTSTRDIAEQVGMRQPSIYKHFSTKSMILAELLDADLSPGLLRVRAALALPGPAAPRLHAYLQAEVGAILSMPYDVRGLYNDDVLLYPELGEQARLRAEIHRLTCELVDLGIRDGELVACDADFVQHAITGLLLEAVRELGSASDHTPMGRALDVADFVLRATLTEPARLDLVREQAADLLEQIETSGTETSASEISASGRTAS